MSGDQRRQQKVVIDQMSGIVGLNWQRMDVRIMLDKHGIGMVITEIILPPVAPFTNMV